MLRQEPVDNVDQEGRVLYDSLPRLDGQRLVALELRRRPLGTPDFAEAWKNFLHMKGRRSGEEDV